MRVALDELIDHLERRYALDGGKAIHNGHQFGTLVEVSLATGRFFRFPLPVN